MLVEADMQPDLPHLRAPASSFSRGAWYGMTCGMTHHVTWYDSPLGHTEGIECVVSRQQMIWVLRYARCSGTACPATCSSVWPHLPPSHTSA